MLGGGIATRVGVCRTHTVTAQRSGSRDRAAWARRPARMAETNGAASTHSGLERHWPQPYACPQSVHMPLPHSHGPTHVGTCTPMCRPHEHAQQQRPCRNNRSLLLSGELAKHSWVLYQETQLLPWGGSLETQG